MVIIGDGNGISICVMHCGILCTVQILGRTLHSISWTIDLSWKNFSILSRHSHNHGLPSMRTVLSIVRCDSSSTERQSRSLSRRSRVSNRGNVRKTSGSTCTKSHLERRMHFTYRACRKCAYLFFRISKLIKKMAACSRISKSRNPCAKNPQILESQIFEDVRIKKFERGF